jgi:putative ABC transport system substrate-binding protein
MLPHRPSMPRDQMRKNQLKRRELLALVAGTAAWPLGARGQQRERMRRVGILMNLASQDPEGKARVEAFLGALGELGWTDARNVKIDTCWGAGDAGQFRRCAAELIGMTPDVILAGSAAVMDPLLEQTRIIPIVFVQTPDPVGAGYVDSLAHPGGNVTGFTQFEYGMAGKWLELLKEIHPNLTRVLVLRDLDATGFGQFGAIAAAAKSFAAEVKPFGVRDASEIEAAIRDFANSSDAGLSLPGMRLRRCIATLSSR